VSKRTPSEIRQCAKCGRDYHAGAQKAKRCPVCGGEIKPKEPKMNVLERIPTWAYAAVLLTALAVSAWVADIDPRLWIR
jgi:hypothetical protein